VLGLRNTAILEGSSNEPSNAYRDTFLALGGTIATRQVATTSGDFAGAIYAIKAVNPDSIVILDYDLDPTAAGQFSQMAYSQGLANKTIGWSTWTNDESVLATYVTAAGATAALGDVAAMEFRRTQDMPGWPNYLAAYTAAGFPLATTAPGLSGPFGYDAAGIIIAAITQAGSSSPAAIRTTIASTQNYQGVVGTYRGFDAYGDAIPQWTWLEAFGDGQWTISNFTQLFLPLLRR
jgi:ABC-type branched-subunit amino acid transport system substrate-binding protein